MFCHNCGSERSKTLDAPCTNCNTIPTQGYGVGQWFGIYFLLMIPLVNIILMIVWACSHKNESIKNYFIANWVVSAVVFVVTIVLEIIIITLTFTVIGLQ